MRIYFRSFVLMLIFAMPGCSNQTAVVVEDSDQAKETLIAALDAWKAGDLGSLAKRTTPIRFVDDDQRAGRQLVDYAFEDEDSLIKPFQNVAIVLSLRNKQGETADLPVTYQVGLEPTLTVLRSDH